MLDAKAQSSRLLTAGYVTFDVISHCVTAGEYWHAVGGTCGNVSTFTSALGVDVTILGRVGEDKRGEFLVNGLEGWGVNIDCLERVTGLPTPAVVQHTRRTAGKTHHFSFRCPECQQRLPKSGVVSMEQAELAARRIDEFDAFFFDRATRSTVHVAEAAREAGLLVMFEPTAMPRTSLAIRAGSVSDIVKFSRRKKQFRTSWMPTLGSPTRFLVETLGEEGVQIWPWLEDRWGEDTVLPAIKPSSICDTAGAGDWLSAGVLTHQLLRQRSLTLEGILRSVEIGQRLSALSLEFSGPSGVLMALGSEALAQAVTRSKSSCIDHGVVLKESTASLKYSSHGLLCPLCLSPSPKSTQSAT